MREGSLPCSVITSHGEPPDSSTTRTSVHQETICVVSANNQNEHPAHLNSEGTNPVDCGSVNNTVWSDSVLTKNNNTDLPSKIQQSGRVRRQKRPYSPTLIEKKNSRKTSSVKSKSTEDKEEASEKHQKPFECEKCSSPYVVNPARSHSAAKTYAPRRVYDPITKKTLIVCNACRLSVARSRKGKRIKKQSVPTEDQKFKFIEECDKFSRSLVEQLKDSDASRLYCPVLSLRPCNCLQKYITDGDTEEQSAKGLHLLSLLKKAKKLSAEKNSSGHLQSPCPRGLLNRKSRAFEEFVQEMRQYLREKLKFCERGCQQVLMYSNNFLHKQLKSAPDQTARIQHLCGSSRQQLCPISKIANENCCQDRCVLMALSHSHLLEEWRVTARRSQRDARRVLAEMLTPSGGTKANCFKFIRMVTGCSHTTICSVNEQMWRTKGNREPPEHGLRRWWKQRTSKSSGEDGCSEAIDEALGVDDDIDLQSEAEEVQDGLNQDTVAESEGTTSSNVADVRIPTARELRELAPAEAGRRLLQQRRKLATIQRQLARQQRHLAELRQQRPPLVLGCCSGSDVQQCINNSSQTAVVQEATLAQAVSHQPQVVHVLEIPATPASVVTNLPDSGQQQSTVSVLSSSGEFEPITNISVNIPPGQPMGTVIFVPEFETLTTAPSDHPPSGNIIFNPNTTETEAIHLQQNATPQKHVHLQVPGPTRAQMPVAHTAHIQSASQPVHLPPVQFHVPLDIPIQLAVQPQVESSVPPSEVPTANEQPPSTWPHSQPIILSPPQQFPYQVTTPSSNSTQNQISLQGAPTAIVNVINKDNQYVQSIEPQVYYLEAVNCATSVPD